MSPGGQPLASFTDRLLAYLIDAGIFVAVAMIVAVPAIVIFVVVVAGDFTVEPDGTLTGPDFTDFLVPFLLLEAGIFGLSLVLTYVYYVEMMFRSGQTFGKKAMRIKVVTLDPEATLGRSHAAKRWLVFHVAGALVPFLSYIDGLWQLWDKPYLQCLHDKFAQTVVVKVPA
ncbi:RDD family protein [Micromonospora sp. CPCC 205371]|nr:RDD family protein [Micromonospora sp. CPCC 205371]